MCCVWIQSSFQSHTLSARDPSIDFQLIRHFDRLEYTRARCNDINAKVVRELSLTTSKYDSHVPFLLIIDAVMLGLRKHRSSPPYNSVSFHYGLHSRAPGYPHYLLL